MAQSSNPKRRPRVRKTAPTVRELVEASQAKSEQVNQPGRFRRASGKAASPLKKAGSTRPVKTAARPVRFVGRGLSRLAPKYLVNSWRELRQVHWPNRRETWRLTLAVFVFAVVFGALVAGVDKGLDELFKKVVLK